MIQYTGGHAPHARLVHDRAFGRAQLQTAIFPVMRSYTFRARLCLGEWLIVHFLGSSFFPFDPINIIRPLLFLIEHPFSLSFYQSY